MLLAYASGLVACGAGAPALRRLPPRFSEFVIVSRPPPVVPVEVQPPRPRSRAVWVEGQWAWESGRFRWDPGAWVIPPAGAGLSVWAYAYQEDGRVRFWPAQWIGIDGEPISAPAPLAVARARLGAR